MIIQRRFLRGILNISGIAVFCRGSTLILCVAGRRDLFQRFNSQLAHFVHGDLSDVDLRGAENKQIGRESLLTPVLRRRTSFGSALDQPICTGYRASLYHSSWHAGRHHYHPWTGLEGLLCCTPYIISSLRMCPSEKI